MNPGPPILPPEPYGDTIAKGCAMGCGWGLAALFLSMGIGIALNVKLSPKLGNWLILSCGLTQWIGIVPTILDQRHKGYRQSPKGLIVAGCVGMLLISACGGMLGAFK
jgi:hypothetical protein